MKNGNQLETTETLNVRPVAGIVSVMIATVAAVVTVPADPEPRGALFFPGLLMSIGLAYVPVMTAIRHPKSILRGENLLVLSPIFWLLFDLLQGAYEPTGITPAETKMSFIAIGVFVLGVWFAAIPRPWRMPTVVMRSVSHEISANALFVLIVIAFGLGMLRFAIPCDFDFFTMIHYLGEPRWNAPWSREMLGGRDAFLDHLVYFGYLLPGLTVLLANRLGWLNTRTLAAVVFSVAIAAFLSQGGGRRIIGIIFGMAIILWILMLPRVRLRNVAVVVACVAALLFFMQFMIEYRLLGFRAALEENEERKATPMAEEEAEELFHVDDNFYRLVQVIQLVPNNYPFVYAKHVYWMLVRPVPRVFWPGKPVDGGFNLADAVGETGITLTMSAIGESYMSGGLWAVLIGGLLFGRLAGMASTLLGRATTPGALLVYSVSMMALFAGMRSAVELVLTSYVILAWIFVCWLYGVFAGGRSALTIQDEAPGPLPMQRGRR